jgi:hypothetical protein
LRQRKKPQAIDVVGDPAQPRLQALRAVVFHIERGDLLDILQHPNQARYAGQRIFVVNIDDYAYLVPFVEGEGDVFLKTIIPSRKATNLYLRRRREDG